MCPKRSSGIGITVLLLITVSVCLLSCGDIDQEETEESLRFIEFVLFPTAPYVDKSYVEQVSEEELAFNEIDFEAETAAIREVYKAFISAYTAEDMGDLLGTLDIRDSIEYGTTTGIVYGWQNVKIYIQANWERSDCRADSNWEPSNFYIRPANVSASWTEGSVTGPMFFYIPGTNTCYADLGRFYFTKRSGKWRIHQINGSKYFADAKYRAP